MDERRKSGAEGFSRAGIVPQETKLTGSPQGQGIYRACGERAPQRGSRVPRRGSGILRGRSTWTEMKPGWSWEPAFTCQEGRQVPWKGQLEEIQSQGPEQRKPLVAGGQA